MGVLADLLHTVQGEPPLVATHAVVGRRFTGIAGAAAGAAQPATAGVADTGQGEADAGVNVALARRWSPAPSLAGHSWRWPARCCAPWATGRWPTGRSPGRRPRQRPAGGAAPGEWRAWERENGLDLVLPLLAPAGAWLW